MKCVLALIAVLMMSGCAEKKPVKAQMPKMVVTLECVVGFVGGSKCEAISADLAVCHVVTKIACLKVAK